MGDDYWLLGPEGDRLDALAAAHGVVASLALALRARQPEPRRDRRKAVERQQRALIALAGALARAFRRQGEPGFPVDAEAAALAVLMARADAFEARGVAHDTLVRMPADWPFKRLAGNPAQLALVAAMRLRQALQNRLIHGRDPRRQVQLGAVRDLERELLALARRLDKHEIAGAAALRVVIDRFAVAAGTIGRADIAELLGGDADQGERHGTTILTAGHGCHAA